MNPKGEIVVRNDDAARPLSNEMLASVSELKKQAVKFAECLGMECPYLHIRGKTHIYSFYTLFGNHLLSIYSEFHPGLVDGIDKTHIDTALAPVLKELGHLLRTIANFRK